jgi:hypothetical protein
MIACLLVAIYYISLLKFKIFIISEDHLLAKLFPNYELKQVLNVHVFKGINIFSNEKFKKIKTFVRANLNCKYEL